MHCLGRIPEPDCYYIYTMERAYFEDKVFDNIQSESFTLQSGEYEQCNFNNLDLAGSDMSGFRFINCTFNACNMGNAVLNKTSFIDVSFKGCKLVGLHFDTCNEFLFTPRFEQCILDYASFHKLTLKKTVFIHCSMLEVDFEDADLSGLVLENCNLAGTVFINTNLEKTDFTTSYNYSIDPEKNKIKKARFSMNGIAGLLDKYDIAIE